MADEGGRGGGLGVVRTCSDGASDVRNMRIYSERLMHVSAQMLRSHAVCRIGHVINGLEIKLVTIWRLFLHEILTLLWSF